MILQKILFPKISVCTERELYYRFFNNTDKTVFSEDYNNNNLIFIKKGTVAIFDTYFNSFSIEKWDKYTKLKNVKLRLDLEGKFKITLLRKEKIHNEVYETLLDEIIFDSDSQNSIDIEFKSDQKKGIYTFKIESIESNSIFYGGDYYTDIDECELKDINIAIDICTFKREKFIYKNIETLKNDIINNENSVAYNHIYIYVSDNGKTLDIKHISDNHTNVFYNKNVGGAGGFTRGMIEILKDKEKNKITHTLVMDDDIVIDTASIEKTYIFLKLIKDEFKDIFVGGSMLRLDRQYIQIENGASWNAGAINSLKSGLDLRQDFNVLHNEIEEYTEYNAWWYCCIPMSVINENNLPLPIFIRGDDLEYGLRNIKHLVNLNGVCVWHEPFENKYTSFLHYYIVRNMLIDNSIHCDFNKWKFLKFLFKRVTREMSYYRYKNVDLIYKAVYDFYNGIDWLKNTDGEELHKEIMSKGYKSVPVEELKVPFLYDIYEKSLDMYESKISRLKRFITLNGYLLPSKGYNIVSMSLCRPSNFYRKKTILNYDITTNKGFITEISRKEVFKNYINYLKVFIITLFKYESTVDSYKNEYSKVISVDFWKKYLDI